MPWKITNTVLDPSKAMLRRQAARLSTEPLVCGRVLRVRDSMVISDEQYEKDKARIEHHAKQGVISAERIGGAPAPKAEAPTPAPAPTPEPAPAPAVESAPPASESDAPSTPKPKGLKRRKKSQE